MEYVKPWLVVYKRGRDGNVYPVLGNEETREVKLGAPVLYFIEGVEATVKKAEVVS